jgi:hypothetical protein
LPSRPRFWFFPPAGSPPPPPRPPCRGARAPRVLPWPSAPRGPSYQWPARALDLLLQLDLPTRPSQHPNDPLSPVQFSAARDRTSSKNKNTPRGQATLPRDNAAAAQVRRARRARHVVAPRRCREGRRRAGGHQDAHDHAQRPGASSLARHHPPREEEREPIFSPSSARPPPCPPPAAAARRAQSEWRICSLGLYRDLWTHWKHRSIRRARAARGGAQPPSLSFFCSLSL